MRRAGPRVLGVGDPRLAGPDTPRHLITTRVVDGPGGTPIRYRVAPGLTAIVDPLPDCGRTEMCDARGMHPNVVRVTAAAHELGLVVEPRTFAEGTRTAEDAAKAVGCEVGQIVKSLVFLLDGVAVMALVSGSNRLDDRRLAAALGGARVTRADADSVRAATGYPIGGVPPFGHATALPTAIDEDLVAYTEVWAAAGTPRDVFAVAPTDLVRVTGGTVAPLRVENPS